MTTVHLFTEDKTGGGLEAILRAEARHRRLKSGKSPLSFSKGGTVNGNAQLLAQCGKYELLRFRYTPRIDHVFYVIDGRNAWDLKQLGVQAPQARDEQSLRPFVSTIQASMAKLARGERTDTQWEEICGGFHAHVLIWERESLILPVADRLGLGPPVSDVYAERGAAESVKARFLQGRSRGSRGYNKAIDGPEYLQRIAQDDLLRATVLASNTSLRGIVDELVAL